MRFLNHIETLGWGDTYTIEAARWSARVPGLQDVSTLCYKYRVCVTGSSGPALAPDLLGDFQLANYRKEEMIYSLHPIVKVDKTKITGLEIGQFESVM